MSKNVAGDSHISTSSRDVCDENLMTSMSHSLWQFL